MLWFVARIFTLVNVRCAYFEGMSVARLLEKRRCLSTLGQKVLSNRSSAVKDRGAFRRKCALSNETVSGIKGGGMVISNSSYIYD